MTAATPAVPPWENLIPLVLYGIYTHLFLCILALTFPALCQIVWLRPILDHHVLKSIGEVEKLYTFNFVIPLIRIIISAIICLSYVYSTYAGYISGYLIVFNRTVGLIFLPYFFIKFLYFPRPFQAVFNFYTFMEIFSLVSLIFAKSTDWLNFSFLQAYMALASYFQIEHAIYSMTLFKSTPLHRQLTRMFLQFTAFIFVFASGLQLCERMDDPWDVFSRYTFDLTFHNSLYFTVVTIFTVGYGDFVPFTLLGRLWIIFIIIFGAVLVTRTIGQVMDVVSSLKRGLRSFVKAENKKHCVICGNVKWEYLKPFVQEFYGYEKNMGKKLIVMCDNPNWTEDSWNSFYDSDRKFTENLIYLEGACLSKDDLLRAQVESAEAVFVLSNQHNPDPYSEDSETLKRILTIRSYSSNIPIYPMCALRESMLQIEYALEHIEEEDIEQEGLLRHRSQSHSEFLQYHHRSEAVENIAALHDLDPDHIDEEYNPTHRDFSDDDDNDSIHDKGYDGSSDVRSDAICMQEVEMFLMAENVFCNGLSTLLANLILRAHPPENEGDPSWLLEYKTGAECRFELVQLPHRLHKKKVKDLALVMYDYGIILVATKKSTQPWRPVTLETEINLSSIGLIIAFVERDVLEERMDSICKRFQDSPSTPLDLESPDDASLPRTVSRHTLAGDMLTGDVFMSLDYSGDEWDAQYGMPYHSGDFANPEKNEDFFQERAMSLQRHSSLPTSDIGHLESPFNERQVGSQLPSVGDESVLPGSTQNPQNDTSLQLSDEFQADNNILGALGKQEGIYSNIDHSNTPKVNRDSTPDDESDIDFWEDRSKETTPEDIRRKSDITAIPYPEDNSQTVPVQGVSQAGPSAVQNNVDSAINSDDITDEAMDEEAKERLSHPRPRGKPQKTHRVTFPPPDPKRESDAALKVYSGYGDELPMKMKGHIVACVIGNMALLNLKHFLQRVWTERPHHNEHTRVVAICEDLREEDEAELTSGLPQNRLVLLQGNSLSVETLRKAQFQNAKAVVILACEDLSDTGHIDAKAIFTVMTLDHLLAERSHTFVCSMLNAEESMKLLRAPDGPRRRGANLTNSGEEYVQYGVSPDAPQRSPSKTRRRRPEPPSIPSTRHSFFQPSLNSGPGLSRAASHGGISRVELRTMRSARKGGIVYFPNTTSFIDRVSTRNSLSFFSRRIDDDPFYPEFSFGGPTKSTFRMDRSQSRLGFNQVNEHQSRENFHFHTMTARDECLEKQRYASGELLISSAYVSLLICELQMPGLLDILREVFGGGFGKSTNSRQCWIRTVSIPHKWVDESEKGYRIFREVFEVLLEYGAIVLGLYRAGDVAVRITDHERTEEANIRHDDYSYRSSIEEGSDFLHSGGLSTPDSYVVDDYRSNPRRDIEPHTFEIGGDSVSQSAAAWSADRALFLQNLPNYGTMRSGPTREDSTLLRSEQNLLHDTDDDASSSRQRVNLPPALFINVAKDVRGGQQDSEEMEDEPEESEMALPLDEYVCPTTNYRTVFDERPGGENVLPYVYTSPEPFTLISKNDAVYVLIPPGVQIPEEW